MMKMSHRSICT